MNSEKTRITAPVDRLVGPWFLLFDGSSVDGRGNGHYCGRTTDKMIAEKHLRECKSNPYSVGGVKLVTEHEFRDVGMEDFLTLRERYGV